MLRHLNVIRALVGAILAVSTLGLHAARAETVLTVSTLSFPTMLNIMTDIIMAKGFDTANGLKLQPVLYGSPGAQWAGIAKGEIILGAGSPYQAAKLREDKIPVSLLGTEVSMSVIQVVSRNPAVKSINDLRGRTLAATTGFSEYGYIAMYAKRMGLDLKKDTNLVDASTSLAQAQLQAGRADAIIVWEPSATMVLKQNPDAHVVVTGDEAWKKVSGEPGWDLFLYINTDWRQGSSSTSAEHHQDVPGCRDLHGGSRRGGRRDHQLEQVLVQEHARRRHLDRHRLEAPRHRHPARLAARHQQEDLADDQARHRGRHGSRQA